MPSLVQLPRELHLAIIEHLHPFPTAMLLRLTNKYFYDLIHPLSEEKMKSLEHKAYCVAFRLSYCMDCHRLRPSENFAPKDPRLAYSKERTICIECGMHN